jgi:hypothetical protein
MKILFHHRSVATGMIDSHHLAVARMPADVEFGAAWGLQDEDAV